MDDNKTKGIIYYTDNRIEDSPIIINCREQLKKAAGDIPIVSCSLKPINLGKNIVLENEVRSYPTMAKQILLALEVLDTKYVFFCEHDVLYHPSHFDFIPERDDIYYYNINNWRWDFGKDYLITYDGLTSLSSLCCNRELAIKHYKYRIKVIEEMGLDKERSREPRWARKFGYEPGTKRKRNGGITDEEHIKRVSPLPNVDIRHNRTFSRPKIKLDEFKHKPDTWYQSTMNQIPGWNLKELFNI